MAVMALAAVQANADGWYMEVGSGFGDPDNIKVKSLCVFDGQLYAGTHNNNGCQIWQRSPVVGRSCWSVISTGGFGDSWNTAALSMAEFSYFLGTWHHNLYVGTYNFHSGGGQVWAFDGSTWFQAASAGFGSSDNTGVVALAVFGSNLYAGTQNADSGAEIWHFTGVTWACDMSGGFGSASNNMISSLVVHDGKLYASTYHPDGGEIWMSSDGSVWQRAVPAGFFSGTSGNGVSSMVSAGGALYAAAVSNVTGTQIWRIRPQPELLVAPSGFGSVQDYSGSAMVEYEGQLYVATHNTGTGSEVWRFQAGHWEQVNEDGFGDVSSMETPALAVQGYLFAGVWNTATGAELWYLPVIFADGFESGSTNAWSTVIP
jgi:hypothetical protein